MSHDEFQVLVIQKLFDIEKRLSFFEGKRTAITGIIVMVVTVITNIAIKHWGKV